MSPYTDTFSWIGYLRHVSALALFWIKMDVARQPQRRGVEGEKRRSRPCCACGPRVSETATSRSTRTHLDERGHHDLA